jgi:hypothetical protein
MYLNNFSHININNVSCLVSDINLNKVGRFSNIIHHYHDRIMFLVCSG